MSYLKPQMSRRDSNTNDILNDKQQNEQRQKLRNNVSEQEKKPRNINMKQNVGRGKCSHEGCKNMCVDVPKGMKLCLEHRKERRRKQSALSSKKYMENLKTTVVVLKEVVTVGTILGSLRTNQH
jgi:hypothetical protein